MSIRKPDSEAVLRRMNDLGAQAEHTDQEARDALDTAGVDPDAFVRAIRNGLPLKEVRSSKFEVRVRMATLIALAASAVFFVLSFHFNYRASIDGTRQTARAQLIGPLLPALSSDDPERRSVALVVARQVDPAFAAETAAQLARWEVNTQAQARAYRNASFANRILAGIQKLQISRDPDDRKVAIWNDLLPVLLEARRNREDFVDVAIDYQRVLPLLRVRNPEAFLDSYWGELWILNILLESRIAPVVEAARQAAPDPAVVEAIYRKNAAGLPERDRRAFEEAKLAYVNTLKSLQ